MGDEEWMKLSVEDRCVHKVWKARLNGYEEAVKLFNKLPNEKSPEFSKYAGLLKKFALDTNAVAQEKGLDAILAFLKTAALAPKTCGEVSSAVVTKCLNSARTKTKEKGKEILMLYIELEKQEQLMEEVMNGLSNKQPKIVAACTLVMKEAVRDFGSKVLSMKPIVKSIPKLLEHSDKTVREEAKQLAVEVYRWIGPAIKPSIQNIKPVQLKELEDEFEKLPKKPPKQARFLKSQQDLKAKAEAAGGDDDESGSEEEEEAAPAVDPFDLMEPEEILSKLPKDFYESMEAKKWQTRKEALETIQPLCCKPKLEAGDYADLVKVLKKTISKDSNVMIVAVAGKCMAGLGNGLKKKFSPYAALCVQAILEKFKEKKMMVVTSLRDAIDAVFPSTNFTNIMEDVLAALDSKNPSIKAETCLFLARSFRVSSPSNLPKTVLKPLCQSLVQKLSDTTPDVRESAMQALGTALRIVGEKPMNMFIADLEKLKLDKIKEYCEKVELPEGKGGAKKSKPKEKKEEKPEASSSSRPKTAPPSTGTERKTVKGGKAAKPGGATKPASKSVKGGGAKKGAKKSGGAKAEKKEVVSEGALTDEEVLEKASAILSKQIIDQLASTKWKERLEAMEELTKKVHNMERSEIPSQVFVRFLARGSGFKDANFNVLNLKFAMVAILAEKSNFSRTSAGFVYKSIVDKIGDIKVGAKAKEALTAIGDAVTLGFIAEHVIKYAFEGQKNPKNQAESFNWFSQAIQEFGFGTINAKPFINHIKVALSAINPQVRTSAVTCIGVIYMYMGANIRMLFEDLKPALLSQIDAEIEKVSDAKPPKPFRGLKKGGGGDGDGDAESEEDEDDDDDTGEDGAAGGGMNMQDMVPRVDISGKITDGLLTELGDAKWKLRGEALEKVQTILKEAKFISPNLGDLPTALKARLAESNKLLATTTANICQTIAIAMGPAVKTHVKTLIPGLLFLTADSKATVRQAAVQALTAWEEQVGLAPFIEDETLSSALAKEKPVMKMEIFGWLAEKLLKYRSLPPDLSLCVPYLFSALEDRNADVRKKSQEVLPAFMMHLTYEKMVKMTGKLKPASKTQILGIMEKQRPNIPEKPGKPAKSGKKSKKEAKAEVEEDEEEEPAPPPKKTSKRPKTAPSKSSSSSDSAPSSSVSNSSVPPEPSEGAPAASKKGKPKESAAQKKLSSKSGKKKDDDEDTGPPLLLVGSKEKRFKDEQDLKVLKWNFTAARSEYVDQLKEQMQPCFSKSLVHNMYQDDFKYHVQAITVLTNSIENHKEATIANLDLILKWFTLRFTETNTAVHVKSIDYLQQLFTMLAADDYSLLDIEANSFCPSLVAKVGDNKENIRKGVRKVMKLLMKLYPASKMFVFIMDGLKSKNARQRTECLEELTAMIEVYGLNVCQPSPTKALKEIATQIADRDNSVRSAALNALVQAYQIVGEDIYKQVGKLNDKDLALLEERIKRSGKKPAIANKSAQPVQNKKNDKANRADNKKSALPTTRPATAPEQAPSQTSNSATTPAYFSLDLDKLDLEKPASSVALPTLEDTSVADELLDAEIKIPARSIPKPSMPTEMQLNFMMSQVASNDLNLSIQALAQLDEILKDRDRSKVMISHVDQLLVATAFQLRMAFSKHMGDEESSKNVIRMYRCLVALLVSLFQNSQLSKEASKDVLCDLVNGLITVLIDDRLMKFEDGPQVVRSVNVLMAKVVENSDHSNIIGALLKLLHECVATESRSPKFLQLVMKCLWRMVRLMPNIINDIVVEKILLDMHNFLRAFPSPVWKERSSDTPLRTVKTMLHSLAKILGPKVLTYLSAIPDSQESEVELYLKKVLKSSQRSASFNSSEQLNNGSTSESEKNYPQGGERNTPRKPSAKTNDLLAEIFKKIGSKENTREGLAELYDFKQKYPDVNIDPFLKKTSQFFQTYIEHGLKTITLERESAHSKIPLSDQTSVITPGSDSGNSLDGKTDSGDMSNYLERIRVLRAKCGFENNPEEAPSGGGKHAVKTESGTAFADSNKEITLGSSSSLIPSHTAPSAPDNNMDDLKKRLERIKREQKK